jgi:hypothetical protein
MGCGVAISQTTTAREGILGGFRDGGLMADGKCTPHYRERATNERLGDFRNLLLFQDTDINVRTNIYEYVRCTHGFNAILSEYVHYYKKNGR